jgi:hypothetical protein
MADGAITAPQAGKNTRWNVEREEFRAPGIRSVGFQPFVFTTATSGEGAAAKTIA